MRRAVKGGNKSRTQSRFPGALIGPIGTASAQGIGEASPVEDRVVVDGVIVPISVTVTFSSPP